MSVICIEEEAYFDLLDRTIAYVEKKLGDRPKKWIDEAEAMSLLNIKSKTTMQEYRDHGDIGFTQPRKKVILYDRESIDAFLEKHAKKPFR
ncbi:helix-turn-helix domain-containing protein [uncultured Croceitalea sp.]|uniref:helix-turn-helix domain-containing protein n=1 Tax=uncultured Croceitalea sp. TaxID=1798908 RepID=UPI00374E74A3